MTACQTIVNKPAAAAPPAFTPLRNGLLQRKCACGGKAGSDGECEECRKKRLQAKLTIGASNDPLEHEADRVAEQVMAAPAHLTTGSVPPCIQRFPEQANGQAGTVPASVDRVLATQGSPLEPGIQQDMSQRFGHNFSQVRVHSGATAEQSAREVNALAYTVGQSIVFGRDRFAPATLEGRRLLAHELTHVVQQSGEGTNGGHGGEGQGASKAVHAPIRVHRKCGPVELGPPAPDCAPSDAGVVGWQFLFKQNCDELRPHEEANIAKLRPGSVRVHGFASIEGPKGFNMALSCHRANRIAELIRAKRPDCRVEGTFKHGATPQPLAGAVPDANPPGFWRDVIVEQTEPASSAATANPRCGPDSTDWLISQIASAKKNVRVLEVQKQLATAAVSAPNISSSAKLDSTEIVEGAVAAKVIQQRQAAGNPRPTADANTQLSDAQIPLLEFQTAGMLAMSGDTDAIITLLALRKASLLWKDLVGTRRPFDFKNDPATMGNPRTTNCPGSDCKSTLTLCPGEHESNCFGQDVPGNLFYAAIGAFVGFNENTLQLGSQWAQLASTKHWDPPEDTAMIAFGAIFPDPLTRAAFCAALQGAKTKFDLKPCSDCNEPATARIVNPP